MTEGSDEGKPILSSVNDATPLAEGKITPSARLSELRRKRARKNIPIISEAARTSNQLEGRISVLESPLSSEDGLLAIIEGVKGSSQEANETIKQALITGAATELTGWALGYPGNRNFNIADQALWNLHHGITETYIHNLLDARSQIPEKVGTEDASEVSILLHVTEKALTLPEDEIVAYMEAQAQDRARVNLGFGNKEVDPRFGDLLEDWTNVELSYLQRNLVHKARSEGRKDIGVLDSPKVSTRGLYEPKVS